MPPHRRSFERKPRNPLSRRCAKGGQTGEGRLRRLFQLRDVLGLRDLTVDFEALKLQNVPRT